MTGLDLSAVETALNAWAIDDLRIDRDNGVADDELDPETLLLIPAQGIRMWMGKGAVQPLTGYVDQGDPDTLRIIDETGARYRALIPLRRRVPARVGDVLTVDRLHSPSADPRLSGRSFVIVALGAPSSFAVVQFLYLKPLDNDLDDQATAEPTVLTGHGPPPDDLDVPPGMTYIDLDTGDVYEFREG